MFDQKYKKETLDLVIKIDKESGLPLLGESSKILFIIQTYLPLPFTIAEYGCGKKASILIRKLISLGIPAYAIHRGMMMEMDMSEAMLQEEDYRKRPHALVAANPLYHPKDFYQEALLNMLAKKNVVVETAGSIIKAGNFVLHHSKEVQFKKARSHIFTMVTFWDNERNQPAELAIDPSLNLNEAFPAEEMRELLHDEEALIFTAPLTARFHLDPKYLTEWQSRQMEKYAGENGSKTNPVRRINKAAKGSIGDPEVWSYSNNLVQDDEHDRRQIMHTGKGDILRDAFAQMLESRMKMRGEVIQQRRQLEGLVAELYLHDIVNEDAEWSETVLAPLAEVENTIAYFRAARQLAHWYKKGHTLQAILGEKTSLKKLAGLGMRLRQRIEAVARASEDEKGKIDARALNDRFFETIAEAVRQMNEAGLTVHLDKVGNLHGILFPPKEKMGNSQSHDLKTHARRALCICSHLDTVNDGGKYDGRLGVLSGIEVAHVLSDLKAYFNLPIPQPSDGAPPHLLLVTAFNGEEMYFTGEGVSMPGSAAVAGHSSVGQVHKMTNLDGEVFKDKLVELLRFIQQKQVEGNLQTANDFSHCATDDELLDACFEPADFFTRHTYERHIEQGPVLDEAEIPLSLVDTIMGIHQEDFTVEGGRAEQGALDINLRLRQLALADGEDVRITTGVMDSPEGCRSPKQVRFALRCQLFGEKNHAGATRYADRRDAGVAAARLAAHFVRMVEKLNEQKGTQYLPLVGGIELLPGTNRNVIPESAALTLAINSPAVTEDIQHQLRFELHGWIISKLSDEVKYNGEGIHDFSIEPISFISPSNLTKFSIDLRAANAAAINGFLKKARAAINEVAAGLGLKITSEIQQELEPYQLARSGQVLQLERSFGGSHNPNEAQLEADLLRGTLLQLNVVREFLQLDSLERFNLFDFVEKLIPPEWEGGARPFVSGALHDTCNIAGKTQPSATAAVLTKISP